MFIDLNNLPLCHFPSNAYIGSHGISLKSVCGKEHSDKDDDDSDDDDSNDYYYDNGEMEEIDSGDDEHSIHNGITNSTVTNSTKEHNGDDDDYSNDDSVDMSYYAIPPGPNVIGAAGIVER